MNVWSIIICKEAFLKAYGSLRSTLINSKNEPTLSTQKMNHVANHLILKIISVQKFSTLVLKFKDFLKNTFKWGFVHILRLYSYKTDAFTNKY